MMIIAVITIINIIITTTITIINDHNNNNVNHDHTFSTQPSVNVRLKWLGLFHRDKYMPGGFMWRMRCPNGSYSMKQWKEVLKVLYY